VVAESPKLGSARAPGAYVSRALAILQRRSDAFQAFGDPQPLNHSPGALKITCTDRGDLISWPLASPHHLFVKMA